MTKATILIVEDDRALADVIAYNLNQAGYNVLRASDGQDGLNQARLKLPQVIILDLMLPVVDGLEVCRRLRADPTTRDIHIMMLTSKSEETDELIGFSVGADDYVTKPFSVKVLLERIKALQRRRDPTDGDVTVRGGVSVDRLRFRVTSDNRPIEVTHSEFMILDALIRQPGRVYSRAELIDVALGDAIVMERTIDVHIRALRKKLAGRAAVIETVRGVGYRFVDSSLEQ